MKDRTVIIGIEEACHVVNGTAMYELSRIHWAPCDEEATALGILELIQETVQCEWEADRPLLGHPSHEIGTCQTRPGDND